MIHNTRKAFTLTEVTLVLGIIGLVLGGVWVATSTLYLEWRVTKTVNATISLVNGIRTQVASGPTFGIPANTSLTGLLTSMQLVPNGVLGFLPEPYDNKIPYSKFARLDYRIEKTIRRIPSFFSVSPAWAVVGPPVGFPTLWSQGQFYVYTADINAPATNSDAFDLMFDNIPTQACVQLAMRLITQSTPYGYAALAGSAGGFDFGAYTVYTPPMTPSAAKTLCGTSSTATLGLRYSIRG